MKKNKNVFNNLLELVGNTPLVKIKNLTKDFEGTFLAKLESANPGHSSKDRIALHIVENAEKKGILKPGDTIIETTSGNTGFSLAMVSLIKGYDCILAVSSKSSTDKIDMLKAMGAKVYVCPANVAADDPRSRALALLWRCSGAALGGGPKEDPSRTKAAAYTSIAPNAAPLARR